MSFYYRTPLIVRRRQPYIDWANAGDDDPLMTEDLAQTPVVYLVDAAEEDPPLDRLLEEYWPEIFEEELAGWMQDESTWPEGRSIEMFRAWFDVTVGQGVVDLDPDAPLTDEDLDAEELTYARTVCAWCGTELTEQSRDVAVAISDTTWLEERRERAVSVRVDDEHVPIGIVAPADGGEAARPEIVFRVCSRACMQAVSRRVPAALRRLRHQVQ